MGKNCDLVLMRAKLDQAITYGSKNLALKVAREGLNKAKKNKLGAEIEYFLGQLQLLKGNFTLAIEHFDAAIKINPKDGGSYNDRALCMVELGIIDEAFVYFDKGIEVEPDYATIYHNKGWLLNNIGKYNEAIGCFKKALALEPDRAVTFDNLADALYNLGNYSGSVKAYRKVLELLSPGMCRSIRKQIKERVNLIEKELKRG